jgi:hypothetical protein
MSRRLKEFNEKLGTKTEVGFSFRQEGPAHRPCWHCRVEANGLSDTAQGSTQSIAKEAACEKLANRLTAAQRPMSKLNPASQKYEPGKKDAPIAPHHRIMIVRTDLPLPKQTADFSQAEIIYFFGPHLKPEELPAASEDNIAQSFCQVGKKDPAVTTAAILLFIGLYNRDFTEIFMGMRKYDQLSEQTLEPTIQAAACFGIRIAYRYYT